MKRNKRLPAWETLQQTYPDPDDLLIALWDFFQGEVVSIDEYKDRIMHMSNMEFSELCEYFNLSYE